MDRSYSINAYCLDKGWLFNDLKKYFSKNKIDVSTFPLNVSDIWICIRSSEMYLSPDITRTIVQVHNMEPHDMHLFNAALGVVFTHSMQEWLWKRSGFQGKSITVPIGSREEIKPFNFIPERPTVGFFCGENRMRWKGSPIFKKTILLAKQQLDFDVLMIGRGLDHIADLGVYENRAANPDDYKRIDILFAASISPGIPLSVYEACACGKTVITTPRWFPKGEWPSIRVGETPEQLLNYLVKELKLRHRYLNNAEKMGCAPYILERWIEKNIDFSCKLFEKNFSSSILLKK